MDSQLNNGSRRRQAQRGVSLIEILVVLVILVTGILTIIRLFPSGFFSIQSTGNAALANSLGGAALNLGAQDAQGLPDAIVPDDLAMDDLSSAVTNAAAYSSYDPDDPNNLENARVVQNETVAVPTAVNGQSVYVVNYGPVSMPADPTVTAAQFPSYFTVNSPYWAAQSGNSALSTVVSSAAAVSGAVTVPTDIPQDTLTPGHEQFLVDLANKKIAVPYAAYTQDNTPGGAGTFPLANGDPIPNANSYRQKIILVITCTDGSRYTKYLDVPAATRRDKNQPYAPQYVPNASAGDMSLTYLPDTASDYQGGWFDPTATYQDNPAGGNPTSSEVWASVALYRPYAGYVTGHDFSDKTDLANDDPYEFKLTAANIVTAAATGANPGAVGFNPKAATGSGAQARRVQISYIVYSWSILREDHDIPALSSGGTFAVRTAVPNLLLAGSANPDNSINSGIAGSSDSMVIMDLDTGGIIAPLPATSAQYDPTNLDKPINNEDLNGTSSDAAVINVSYSLGRLTFGSQVFGDSKAHRVRIFYTADLNWAVAVQKAPAYFTQVTPSGTVSGTTPLGAAQFAYDGTQSVVYFARCNAGKTVEIDGTYTLNGKTQGFSDTIAVGQVLAVLGDSNVSVSLNDGTKFESPVPPGAAVTFSAVRGLSSRSIVAWKERNLYKVHTVDAVLNRTQ